jgi:hypothetical protein
MTTLAAVVGYGMLLVSVIALIQPLPYIGLATRKRALIVLVASLVIFGFAVRRSRATIWPVDTRPHDVRRAIGVEAAPTLSRIRLIPAPSESGMSYLRHRSQ